MSSVGIFESSGYDSYQRFLLFVFVCIPLRLSFSVISYKLRDSMIIKSILLFSGLLSIFSNWKNIKGKPWWSRKTHMVSAMMLVLSVVVSTYNKYMKSLPSLVLLLDVIIGIFTFWFVRPFKK